MKGERYQANEGWLKERGLTKVELGENCMQAEANLYRSERRARATWALDPEHGLWVRK